MNLREEIQELQRKIKESEHRIKEEEVRVFYVAVTGAMDNLIIIEDYSYTKNIDPTQVLDSIKGNGGVTLHLNSAVHISPENKRMAEEILKAEKSRLDNKYVDQLPEDPFSVPDGKGNYLFPEL